MKVVANKNNLNNKLIILTGNKMTISSKPVCYVCNKSIESGNICDSCYSKK